jgi:hypothetical protein
MMSVFEEIQQHAGQQYLRDVLGAASNMPHLGQPHQPQPRFRFQSNTGSLSSHTLSRPDSFLVGSSTRVASGSSQSSMEEIIRSSERNATDLLYYDTTSDARQLVPMSRETSPAARPYRRGVSEPGTYGSNESLLPDIRNDARSANTANTVLNESMPPQMSNNIIAADATNLPDFTGYDWDADFSQLSERADIEAMFPSESMPLAGQSGYAFRNSTQDYNAFARQHEQPGLANVIECCSCREATLLSLRGNACICCQHGYCSNCVCT